MRIAFFAWGSGNGHIVRIGALAKAAVTAGHQALVCTTAEQHLALLQRHGLEGRLYPREQTNEGHWSRWHAPGYVRNCIEWDQAIMHSSAAELVVHDGRPSVGVAAGTLGIPVTAVLQSIHLPGHRYQGRGDEAIWATMADAFNAVADFGSYADGREAIALGGVALPSIPEIDPVPASFAGGVRYLGPLTAIEPLQTTPERCAADREQTLFYKVRPTDQDCDEFLNAFADMSDRIVIATGGQPVPEAVAVRFECVDLIPAAQIDGFRSAVIHAGHGTSLLMLQLGVPLVALPGGSPERQQNARNLQALGVALTIEGDDGSWELHDHPNDLVDWQKVRRQLEAVHADPALSNAASNWRQRLASTSPVRALNAVLLQSRLPGYPPNSRSQRRPNA